ncbi:DUF6873 family GME fold protein [uncultured Clostridium sp.]|uniref:DUF6873 family GME fold protein n=1 Tax=uncultured Clostridium sp. TaxID=59620 RepID=UPI00258C9F6D|nr:hypothetical protein [uncultured Clostridium sp.]MDU1347866.1 hypothetical protein [Clostridium argentinense]
MKLAIVDFRISNSEIKSLQTLGCKVLKCPPSSKLYDAVCGHPDMLIHIISKTLLMTHPSMDKTFINLLQNDFNFDVIFSKNELKEEYPYDITLNAVNLSNYFIHNIKYTDEYLLKHIKDKTFINVNQGYSKCSTAIINDNAIITSDKSIAKALSNTDIDILLLPPGDIELPGLNYGFIGGSCGLLDNNHLVFYGNLKNYKYGNEVLGFLDKYSITPIYLSDSKLIDRGSIFFLDI